MEIKQRIGGLELRQSLEGLTGKETAEELAGIDMTILWEYWPTKERFKAGGTQKELYGMDVVAFKDEHGTRFVISTIYIEKKSGEWNITHYGDLLYKGTFEGITVGEMYEEFVRQVEEIYGGGYTKV